MRYEGTRPSRVDKQTDVHVFAVGIRELELLRDLARNAYLVTPKLAATQQTRARLKNMHRTLDEAVNARYDDPRPTSDGSGD